MDSAGKWPWLALGMGAFATLIGIVLTAMNVKNTADIAAVYLIFGGTLTAFGPVVISYAVSKRIGRREATDELQGHLESISINLGQSVATLDHALRRNAANVEDPRVTLTIANNVVSNIEVQIGQLQKLIGAPFSAESLLTTKEQLVALTGSLTKAVAGDDPDAVLEATRGLQKAVRKLVKPAADLEREEVRCPSCGTQFLVGIASFAGATAQAVCPRCGSRFNVHRDGRGALFVRITSGAPRLSPEPITPAEPSGSSGSQPAHAAVTTKLVTPVAQPRQISISCPSCEGGVKFWLDPAREECVVVCLKCDTGITVGPDAQVIKHDAYTRQTAPIQRAAQNGYIVECPECRRERACRIRVDGDYFGYCTADKLTLAIPAASIGQHASSSPAPVAS